MPKMEMNDKEYLEYLAKSMEENIDRKRQRLEMTEELAEVIIDRLREIAGRMS